MGTPIYHSEMAHPMLVRISSDAHHRYVNDPRWEQADSMEKQFALRMIMEIAGGCYPVISADVDEMGTFYNIRILPALEIPDPMGITRKFNAAFVPADYVTVIKMGFPEAR
jgi:hypothetical protein